MEEFEIITKGTTFDMLEAYYKEHRYPTIRIVDEAYHVEYPGTYGSAPHHIPIMEYRRGVLDTGQIGWMKKRVEN